MGKAVEKTCPEDTTGWAGILLERLSSSTGWGQPGLNGPGTSLRLENVSCPHISADLAATMVTERAWSFEDKPLTPLSAPFTSSQYSPQFHFKPLFKKPD